MGNDDSISAFFGGVVTALACVFLIMYATRGTLEEHELYRFCLIKNIPLEECIVPTKPYKGEIKQNDR